MTSETRFLPRLICAFSVLASGPAPVSASDFLFNFDPHGDSEVAGGANVTGSTFQGNDGTRFYQDVIRVDGVDYFHIVVGDPALGFAQESYTASVVERAIPTTGDPNYNTASAKRPYSPDSGGNERLLMRNFSTDQGSIGLFPNNRFGNAREPFGETYVKTPSDAQQGNDIPLDVDERYRISGIGTMDPSRVVLRLSVSDADISMEVFKPFLTRKPKVSQTLVDGVLTSEFTADMRGLTYDDINRAAPITNRLAINDPDMPGDGSGANFDMSMSQKPYITAGRFTFARIGRFSSVTDPETEAVTQLTKYGWQEPGGWDVSGSVFNPGVYNYFDDGFDPLTVDWTKYFDPAQN